MKSIPLIVVRAALYVAVFLNAPSKLWAEFPSLPNEELGVAGPFAGVHNDALLVVPRRTFQHPSGKTIKSGTTRSLC